MQTKFYIQVLYVNDVLSIPWEYAHEYFRPSQHHLKRGSACATHRISIEFIPG
jgi:hypothetical protein